MCRRGPNMNPLPVTFKNTNTTNKIVKIKIKSMKRVRTRRSGVGPKFIRLIIKRI